MKNLIKLLTLSLVLQSCGGSGGSSGTGANSNLNPAVALNDIPDGSILTNNVCYTSPQNYVDGPYYKISFIKSSSTEFDAVFEYYPDSSCDLNTKLLSIALLRDVVSANLVNNATEVSLSLVDAQINITDNGMLSFYQNSPDPFFGKNWILNNLTSVIDLPRLNGAPVEYPSGYISKLTLEIFKEQKRVLINGSQFTWQ